MKLSIEFTRPAKPKPFSQLIRCIQGTEFSHVRLTWYNSRQTRIIYEASGSHIKFLGTLAAELSPVKVIETFDFELTKEQRQALVDLCIRYAGLKYSKAQVINIGLANLGISWKPFKQDSEYAQVCSEVVARVLAELGYCLDLNPDMAGPKELYDQLRKVYK